MKIPRDLSGNELARLLKAFEYKIVRQSGSHIRLTTHKNGEHHITIPAHSPLKIGTLSGILNEVAVHLNLTKEELMQKMFD